MLAVKPEVKYVTLSVLSLSRQEVHFRKGGGGGGRGDAKTSRNVGPNLFLREF